MDYLLHAEGLAKAYGPIVVVDNVSLSVAKGECLGVIGPNGAGKTSLFNVLDGGVAMDAGRIVLDGQDVSSLPRHKRARKGVARAYQIPQPFPDLTVYENVLVSATFATNLSNAQAARHAMSVIDRVGLHDRRNALAGGITLLDRKRLEVAKALAAQPKLLLLDEIAGGLTEAEVDVLVTLIKEIKPDFAIIWIEHVARALEATADRLLALHFGAILMEGLPHEVLSSPLVQEIYLGIVADVAA